MENGLLKTFKSQPVLQQFENLPQRIFMDTNVVQYINDFGEFIFEDHREHETYFQIGQKKIHQGTFVFNQIEALQQIFWGIDRTSIEFVVSEGVYKEIIEKNDYHLNNWFYDLWQYWETIVEEYNGKAFTGEGKVFREKLQSDNSIKGALSRADFKIFCDAIMLECDAILTCDKFRNRQSWLYKKYGIMILYPSDFIELTSDYKALWS